MPKSGVVGNQISLDALLIILFVKKHGDGFSAEGVFHVQVGKATFCCEQSMAAINIYLMLNRIGRLIKLHLVSERPFERLSKPII